MSSVKRDGKDRYLKIEVAGSESAMDLDSAIRALVLLARWAGRKAQNKAGASEPLEDSAVIDDVSNGYTARKELN